MRMRVKMGDRDSGNMHALPIDRAIYRTIYRLPKYFVIFLNHHKFVLPLPSNSKRKKEKQHE